MQTLLEKYRTNYGASREEEMSLDDYLDLCRKDPGAYATPAERTDVSAAPEIEAALQEIAAVAGPTAFTLYERATLSSMLNSEAKASGARAEFEQVATAFDGGIVADVDIALRASPARLETRMAVAPGKTVVIGQNGVEGDDTRLFYVVRAELVDAA